MRDNHVERIPMIDLVGVSKFYQIGPVEVRALEDVELHVARGEFVVVLGPSGSGNLNPAQCDRCLGGAHFGMCHGGRVGCRECFSFRAVRSEAQDVEFRLSKLQAVPRSHGIGECGVRCGRGGKRRSVDPHDVLEAVGLSHRTGHSPHELSGSQQQRVAIARPLATGNPVLLADEPTGEPDFETGAQILELLIEQAAADRAVLVVTHNREIARIGDRVVEMSSGRIISDGPPAGGKTSPSQLHW